MKENKLFKHFGVNSNEELLEFIKNNPDDPRSKEMMDMMKMFFGQDFDFNAPEDDIELEEIFDPNPARYDDPNDPYDWRAAMERESKCDESL